MKKHYSLGSLAVVFLLLALTSCATAPLQEPIALDHAALHVADLGKSASFYEALGLKRIADPFMDGRMIWLSAGSHRQLHLIPGRAESSAPDMPVHLAFVIPSIPAAVARLEAAGIPYYDNKKVPQSVATRPDGVRQIFLQDPDGYWVELNDAPVTAPR